jgi:hypothetical protein
MVRTVAFSQHKREPIWLTQGKLALQTQQQPEQFGEGAQALFADIGARTARRFARIAEFLQQNFPLYFNGEKRVRAGSAAVLEFMQLFEVNRPAALEIAELFLGGQYGVRELKSMRDELQGARPSPAVTSRAEGSRRASQFAQLAEKRLHEAELIPGLEPVENSGPPTAPRALMPDFLMVEKSTGCIVAMEIKAPSDTAARSLSYVAGQLVSRVAALRLRYADAVLVLPSEAETIANETIQLWDSWITKKEPVQQGLSILLLDEKTHRLIKSKRKWHDEGSNRRKQTP